MKKFIHASALAALCALVVAGCAPTPSPTDIAAGADNRAASHGLSVADAKSCSEKGGTIERRGRAGIAMCVTTFGDAGKSCTDSQQCQGKCIGAVGDDRGSDGIVGQCQADNRLFGCYSEVLGGRTVHAICVD